MAKWKHILADSGGSNTVWAFCGNDGTTELQKTASLHPKFALRKTTDDWGNLCDELGDLSGEKLIFYGAGCGQESMCETMKRVLLSLGFGTVEVYPDTLGACRAACGNVPGAVAILGTGSVLLEYDGQEIVQRIGGFGSLVGDEGSGFHFARLVVKDYLNGILPEEKLSPFLGMRGEVLAMLASPQAQEWLAAVGGKVAGLDFEAHHRRNLEGFLEEYVTRLSEQPVTLSVVGSYGFHQRRLLADLLAEKGAMIGTVCDSPIDALVRFHDRVG
jgi:hypothetical protein